MASLLTPPHLSFLSRNPKPYYPRLFPHSKPLFLSPLSQNPNPKPSPPLFSAAARGPGGIPDEWGEKSPPDQEAPPSADPPKDDDEWGRDSESGKRTIEITDEWGEKADPEPESVSDADPPKDEDEWGNGSIPAGTYSDEDIGDKLGDLKRCLVDTIYGTDLGFRAVGEVRAEVLELVNQLEAENPNPNPVDKPELLDGNWILLYTAFSELLPLLAAGSTPLLKVKKITQEIDSKSLTIVNSTTLSSPFASFSFSATASFVVRTPSRIQVQFKEGTFQPPEISSSVDLPEQVDVFGQKISLQPVQRALNPIQEAFANITRAISGQPPLKIPIPGNVNNNRAESWLLTTYLDQDFRISRGDGGLFILAKEGSPLLDQLY